MRLPLDRPECCLKNWAPFPKDEACFCRELARDLKALHLRHCRAFVNNPRLMEMAEPVRRVSKFVPKCPCFLSRPIEIVRLDQPVRTRTEQLALPYVWKLLLFKKQVKTTYPASRMYVLNRLIRNSLLSLYSHLYNVQPPQEPKPKYKWTKREWREHRKHFLALAEPKLEPMQPKIRRKAKPFEEMKRYKKLARPKKYEPEQPNIWKFTPAMKAYTPSDRIKEMSTPKKYDEDLLYQSLPIRPPETALKYKPSARVKELAEPLKKQHTALGENDLKENPFAISPNALKAKPSKRTKELAEPKEYENVHIRDNPNAISPAALKAKATPRTIELAKPKGS